MHPSSLYRCSASQLFSLTTGRKLPFSAEDGVDGYTTFRERTLWVFFVYLMQEKRGGGTSRISEIRTTKLGSQTTLVKLRIKDISDGIKNQDQTQDLSYTISSMHRVYWFIRSLEPALMHATKPSVEKSSWWMLGDKAASSHSFYICSYRFSDTYEHRETSRLGVDLPACCIVFT